MAPIISKLSRDDATGGSGRRSSRSSTGSRQSQRAAFRHAARHSQPVVRALKDIWSLCKEAAVVVAEDVEPLVVRFGLLVDKLVQCSARFLESYCCLDVRRYAKGHKQGGVPLQGSLPVLFVLFLLMMLYNAFVFAYMPAVGIALNSPTSLIFHAFVSLVLASFVQAVRTDPGGVPNTKEWRTQGCPPEVLKERKRKSGDPRWCQKTEAYKPDRAHYCRILNRTVLRMDHHCPWLGNTVGFANHKFFFLFIMYANCACGVLGGGIIHLLVQATLPSLNTFLLLGAEGLTSLLLMILVPFFLFHVWLLARNMTTIEFCEVMSRQEDFGESPYNQGVYSNICSVLGSNPLLWLLPVGGPAGDGLSFPRAARHESNTEIDAKDDVEKASVSAASSVHDSMASPSAEQKLETDPEATHQPADAHKKKANDSTKEPSDGAFAWGHANSASSAQPAPSCSSEPFLADAKEDEAGENDDGGVWGDGDEYGDEYGETWQDEFYNEDHTEDDLDDLDLQSTGVAEGIDYSCFFVWCTKPEEFKEDLEIGFEVIGEKCCGVTSFESLEDSFSQFLSRCNLCLPRRRALPETQSAWRRQQSPTRAVRGKRSSHNVGLSRNGAETDSTASVDGGSEIGGLGVTEGGSEVGGSAADFFSE